MTLRKLAKGQPCYLRLEGCTHDTHGLVEFKGVDRYMGQASLRFYSVDHDETCYWLPESLDMHFGTAQETRALCPHGMPLAENVCGPCSEGRPNSSPRISSLERGTPRHGGNCPCWDCTRDQFGL